jgi:hypothetical protein
VNLAERALHSGAMRRALLVSALISASFGAVGVRAARAEPAAAALPALPSAAELADELTRLARRPGLSRHAADLVTQASGVHKRLKEASAEGMSEATLTRLTRLLHALLRAADASDARDRERAAYATSARRIADVEAQLAAKPSSADAGSADAGSADAGAAR